MLVIILALAATALGATGTYLTKSLSLRMPVWQAVAPLFAINALLVIPLIPFGPRWRTLEPSIIGLHIVSIAVLCGSTACMFALITCGRASSVAVGQALSPSATLVAAPLLLGTIVTPITAIAVLALMLGALIPLRRTFEGIASGTAIALLLTMGLLIGLLGVFTAMLATRGVGLPEIYFVRTALAALIFLAIAPPAAMRPRDIPSLTVRSTFVTGSFLLTILAIERGSVVIIQSILATAPLMVIGIEWSRHRTRPDPAIVTGSVVALVGLLLLLQLG